MSFFQRTINDKKNFIHLFVFILFLCGFLFGFIYYDKGSKLIVSAMSELFFISKKGHTNDYNYYIFIISLYIVVSILCSTSYLGIVFVSFIIFSRGMHILIGSIHLLSVVQIPIMSIVTVYLPQLIIELLITYVISIISIKLSINSFMIAFVLHDNYHIKKVLNYVLDYLIVILILLTVSMLFRVYLI